MKVFSYVVVAALIMGGLFAWPAAAQEEGAPVGTLYFTNKVLTGSLPATGSTDVCGPHSFQLTTEVPTAAASLKAYGSPSYLGSGCATHFDFGMDRPTTLAGSATVTFWVGCDLVSLNFPAGLSSWRVHLYKGTTQLGVFSQFTGSGLCTSGTSEKVQVQVPTADAEFKVGDLLRVTVWWWRINTPPEVVRNSHFLVFSTTHPSSVSAEGLNPPSEAELAAPEVFELTGPAAPVQTAPGKTVSFNVSVKNTGPAGASYSINSTTYDGFGIQFEPASGNLSQNGSAEVTTILTVGAQVTPATYQFNFTVAGPNGGNATIPVLVLVSAADGGPTDSASATITATEQAKPAEEKGGGIPGFGLVAFAAAVAAALAVAHRRRR